MIMVLAAFILSLLSAVLWVTVLARAYVNRRRAMRALSDAIKTMAAVDAMRTSRWPMPAASVAPVGDLFPKGRN